MTQLAAAVDADDELWTLDALPSTRYVQVEDETVEVRSPLPSQTYTLTGQDQPPRIRVRRGVGGTTAASHNNGTALTAVYGLGGGGGGGAITVDNQDDPPAEVTTIVASGAVITGDEADIGPIARVFYSETDPGAVGAGAIWIRNDDAAALQATFVRNEANTAWLTTALAIYGDGFASPATLYIRLDADPLNVTVELFADGYTALIGSSPGISFTAPDGTTVEIGEGAGINIRTPDLTRIAAEDEAILIDISGTPALRIEGTGVAFNAAATSGVGVTPVLPASPTEQDIADALVALGLCTQAA